MASKYPNSGTLGRNEKRREGTQDPEYSGQCEVDGVAYWVNAWVKTGKEGSKFFSLAFRPKDASARPKSDSPVADLSDDIPF